MKFLVHVEQGGGCDYTIGCGHDVQEYEADTRAEVVAAVKLRWFGLQGTAPVQTVGEDDQDYVEEDRGRADGIHVQSITIYEITNPLSLNVQDEYALMGARKQATEQAQVAAKEEAEFQRLLAKRKGKR